MIVRTLVGAVIGIALVLAPCRAHAIEPASAEEAGTAPKYVSINLAPTVKPPELLRGWTIDAIDQALSDVGLTDAQVEGRELVVEIGGKTLAFEVKVGVREGSSWIAGPESTTCKCYGDEFVAHVRGAVGKVAPELRQPETPTPPRPDAPGEPPPPSDPPAAATTEDRRPLGKPGIAGAVLVGLGAPAMIAGAVLLGIGDRETPADGDSDRLDIQNYRPPGGATLGAGAALTIAGIVLLAVDKKRRRSERAATIAPAVGRGGLGVTIVGRF